MQKLLLESKEARIRGAQARRTLAVRRVLRLIDAIELQNGFHGWVAAVANAGAHDATPIAPAMPNVLHQERGTSPTQSSVPKSGRGAAEEVRDHFIIKLFAQ